jgi:hypothetical protein
MRWKTVLPRSMPITFTFINENPPVSTDNSGGPSHYGLSS